MNVAIGNRVLAHRSAWRAPIAALTALLLLLLLVPPASADVERLTDDGFVPASRFAGDDRYDTARLIAIDDVDGTPAVDADTVVLARGDVFADGLAGSYVAGLEGAPVLLTRSDALPQATVEGLDELGPDQVILLGGTEAISSEVEDGLADDFEVVRLAGGDRFATASEVARHGTAGDVGQIDGEATAIVATGRAGADALAASPLAAGGGFPLLLSEPDTLPHDTADALADLDIEHVIVVGGEAAISPEVQAEIEGLGTSVRRLAGDDRDMTALAIAELTRDELGWESPEMGVAARDERGIVDALALGPRLALTDSPMVLAGATGPAPAVRSALDGFESVGTVVAAGGQVAVPAQALAAVRTGFALRAEGLAFPRGLTIGPDGAVYVAEVGTGGDECVGEGEERVCVGPTGAVTRIEGDEQSRVFEGLTSVDVGAGVADVAFDGDRLFAPVGLGVPAQVRDAIAGEIPDAAVLGTLSEVTDEGLEVLADLAAFEADNNSDGVELPEQGPDLNSNPFGLVRDTDKDAWIVADAGANALLEVSDDGDVELITVFPTADTPDGPREAVPTAVVVGPDGDYYVSELAGEAQGTSRVWQVDAESGDLEVYEDGFTFALDLGFGADGSLYVLQAVPSEPDLSDPQNPGPGTVVRVDPEGQRTELGGGGLTFPVGLAVTDDALFVSNCAFCPSGEVLELSIP